MAWLSGWGQRVKLTIDQNDIDAALSDFPILLHLGTSVGRNSDDVSFVFDELTSDANRKKIAVTTSDGETECYVEIEQWDDANEKAWLWVKVPSVASGADTDLYLYFDSDHADNDSYVGDPNSTPAESVWDSNFKFVSHMRDDPDTSHIRDSSTNDNDGTKKAAGEPAVTTSGKISDAQDFDGVDDSVNCGTDSSLDISDQATLSCWVYRSAASGDISEHLIRKNLNYILRLHTDGTLRAYYWEGSTRTDYTSTDGVGTGAWHKVAIVIPSTAANAVFYLDGSAANIGHTTKSASALFTYDLLLGGAEEDAEQLDGIIDEVRISNTARTAAWIKAEYESERDDLLDWGSEEAPPTGFAHSFGIMMG